MKSNNGKLSAINQRIKTLIGLNAVNKYTEMISTANGLVSNPKCDQYLGMLYYLKAEKRKIEISNRNENLVYANQLENAKGAVVNLIGSSMFSAVENQ